MVYDTLTSLVESAKSVFQPRNAEDIDCFENYIFNNYISDMELEDSNMTTGDDCPEDSEPIAEMQNMKNMQFLSPETAATAAGPQHGVDQYSSTPLRPRTHNSSLKEKKFKRISMIELPAKGLSIAGEDKEKPNLQRFRSMQ